MAIRVLHFADLHLGVENYGKINNQTGLHTRFEDFERTLKFVVDYALSADIHLVIFAGDAYKNRDPTPTHQRVFAEAIQRFSSARIPTVVLVGNHDVPNTRGRAHAVEVFRVLEVPFVTVADIPRCLTLDTAAGKVQVIAIPYRRTSILMERTDLRDKNPREVNEALISEFSDAIRRLSSQLDGSSPAVLAAHVAVGGASLGSERSMLLSEEPLVPLSLLLGEGIDYVALGHIHKYQNLNTGGHPPVVYPGSLERIDFGEERDTKGFVVATITRGSASIEFVETPARRFVTIEAELGPEPEEDLRRMSESAMVEDAIVRVRFTTSSADRNGVSVAQITRALPGAFQIGRVERVVPDAEHRQRIPGLSNTSQIHDAFIRYAESRALGPDRDQFLALGNALIDEVLMGEQLT